MTTELDVTDYPISTARKWITYVVIAAMFNMVSLPAQAAYKQERERQKYLSQATADDAYTQLVNDLAQFEITESVTDDSDNNSTLATMTRSFKSLFSGQKTPAQARLDEQVQRVLALKTNIEQEHQKFIDDSEERIIEPNKLTQINTRFNTLQALFNTLEKAKPYSDDQQQALTQLHTQLKQWQPPVAHTDMNHLPWGRPQHKLPVPYQSTDQTTSQASVPAIASRANISASADVSDANTPEYTASNVDVQITPAITKLAQELEHNPAKMYKWVYDNITFIPSYGSIQGSELTLQTKRGNSFDTASLLIALLRASNIPARYVHGSIDVPTEQALNWVGGVDNASAAQNLLAQGGVPTVGMKNGSKITKIRMNHVWVEAYVPMLVHRGSKPIEQTKGQSRSWIPLDASFKTYTRTQGIDLAKAVPFDAQKLIDDAKQGATVDNTAGSVQNLNQQAIKQAVEAYQAKVKTYLETNHPNAKASDILGKQTINPYQSQMLSFSLPYKVHTTTATYHTLPDAMRHYFKLTMYGGGYGSGSPIININLPTPKLQGKPLAMSFKPATPDEEQKLINLLPKANADGSPIRPEQLPKTLPANIALIPEITLGKEVLASTGRFNLGADVKVRMGFNSPNSVHPSTVNKHITAGEYHAIGYNLQGMSQQQLENTKKTLEQAKASLDEYTKTQNSTALASLTKHDLTGAMLQATVQSYFAVTQTQTEIAQNQANIVEYPYMSFGTFSTSLYAIERYGVPFRVEVKGLMMDIDRYLYQAVAKDNNHQTFMAFNRSFGVRMSTNEHAIPEQMFDNPDTPAKEAEGISAVKALQIAGQQGQTLYTINSKNQSDILPKLKGHSASVMQDVRNALYANKTITISESPIQYKTWKGTGYIILDNDTGAGAYLIGSGEDGGFFDAVSKFVIPWFLWSMSLKTYLAKIAGVADDLLNKFRSFNRFLILFKSVIDIISIASDCADSDVLISIIAAYLLPIFISLMLMAILGPISALIIPIIFSKIVSINKKIITSGC